MSGPLNGKSNGKARIERLAIVALGPTSLNYIQEVDHAGDRKKLFDETWTFNSYASVIESDRLFHMDDVRIQQRRGAAGNHRVANMLEAMKRYQGPIYTSFPESEYPTMEPFPLDQVAQKFDTLYFSTTPPYALAYAGLLEVPEIYLYGCDYTWPGVAGAESGRACMEFWVGLLKGRGHRISIHPQSSLCNARTQTHDNVQLYGYDRVKMSLQEVEPGVMKLNAVPRELPTAAEIEERYSHLFPGSEIQVDVVS